MAARGASAAASAPRDRGGMGAIVMAGDPGFWDVAWNWPLPFVTAVAVLAVPMAGIIWFICQLRYKQQIATLKDRVELVDRNTAPFQKKKRIADPTKGCNHHGRIVAVCCPELGEFIQ